MTDRGENKMKNCKKITSLALASTLMLTALTACGGEASKPSADKDGNHLNFGCYKYSDSIDPATNVNSSWCGTRYGITECLFKFDKNVQVQPNLCDTYEVSDDRSVWQLHIREGVKFSNGNDLTATAVKNSIERLFQACDADQGGTGNSNPDSYFTFSSIEADDATGVVTINCTAPTPNLPGILCYPYFVIVDTTVIADEVIGTNFNKVDSVNTGVSMELRANEHYWNGEVPYDSTTILFIEDSSTKAMALQSGDVDLVENVTTASDLEKLKADDAFYVCAATGVRTGNAYMNFQGALGNETLRQAILLALDDQTMCEKTVGGMYTSGISVLPSSLAYGYDKLTDPFAFNKEAAIKLLDDAGIVDGDGDGWRELDGVNINLDYEAYSSRNLNDFAQAIALQLGEIGVQVTVNVRDYDTILAMQNAGEFDFVSSNSITVGVGDPQDFMGNWYSGISDSYGFYSNVEYDALYEQLLVEVDTAKRTDIITQLQQILIDDAATIVHGYYNSTMLSNKAEVAGADIATIDYYWLTTDIHKVG